MGKGRKKTGRRKDGLENYLFRLSTAEKFTSVSQKADEKLCDPGDFGDIDERRKEGQTKEEKKIFLHDAGFILCSTNKKI